jgi:hypothetical protein
MVAHARVTHSPFLTPYLSILNCSAVSEAVVVAAAGVVVVAAEAVVRAFCRAFLPND